MASGGGTAGGAAVTVWNQVFTYAGSGGGTAGGSAVTDEDDNFVYAGSGGGTAGGSAGVAVGKVYAASGGGVAGGSAVTSIDLAGPGSITLADFAMATVTMFDVNSGGTVALSDV